MRTYSLSVVQLCPDQYKDAANAIAEAAGYGEDNLSVKLMKSDGSIWWGCHAWWIPDVFEQQTSSTGDPAIDFVLAQVISETQTGGEPYDFWVSVLDKYEMIQNQE